MNTFLPGQKVVCVNDDASFKRVTLGAIYIVEKNWDGTASVVVNGAVMASDRFKAV